MMTQPPFWQPAEARPQIWRTALGLVLVVAIWLGVTFAVLNGAALKLDLPPWMIAEGTTWATSAIVFSTFAGFHIGLALVLPLLHRRGYLSLFGPSRRLNLRHFRRGALATLALFAVLSALTGLEHLLLPAGVSPPVVVAQRFLPWVLGLVPALAFILMQTLGEELLFRGYLLQQLRARFRSPLIWGLAPALIFGIMHYQPGAYGTVNALAYVLNAAVAGTLAAFVTLRTGNLGAAAGLHFGNNATLVLAGVEGNLSGFSLFTTRMELESGYATYSILTQTAVMALAFALWWRWMARHRPIANDATAA